MAWRKCRAFARCSSIDSLVNFRASNAIIARISEGELDRHAPIDDSGRTILHECVAIRSLRAAVVLLEVEKVNVNLRDRDGNSALHVATDLRDGKMVLELLRHGADVSLKNKRGETALHSAILDGDGALAQLLIEYGADIYSKDIHGVEAVLKTTSMQLRTRLKMCASRKEIWFVSSSDAQDHRLCMRMCRAMEKDHGLRCWADAVKPTLMDADPRASKSEVVSSVTQAGPTLPVQRGKHEPRVGTQVSRAKMPAKLREQLQMASSSSDSFLTEAKSTNNVPSLDELLYSNVMCVVMSSFSSKSPHCRAQMELAQKAGIEVIVIWRGG